MKQYTQTLHSLVDHLTESLNLTPEQQFRITAQIKRLIHCEKASVFHRYYLYSRGIPLFEGAGESAKLVGYEEPKDPWIHGLLKEKYKQHQEMAENLTDEELVTWDVGNHKFVQEKPPCVFCAQKITGGYMSTYKEGKSSYSCEPCARSANLWNNGDDDETT